MITVVIAHHLNQNQEILDWCLESVLLQSCHKEIIVVADSVNPPTVPDSVKVIHATDGSLAYPARKFNRGIKEASSESTHFFYLNDDIILGRGVFASTQEAAGEDRLITPLINADNLNLFTPNPAYCPRRFEKDPDKTSQWAKEESFRRNIQEYKPGDSFVVGTNRLYMCAIMIPRQVSQKIGPMDERFEAGWDDEDYILRASVAGIPMGIDTGSFAFHIGSQTLMHERSEERNKSNHTKFINKWGIGILPNTTMNGFGFVAAVGLNQCIKDKQINVNINEWK